MADSLPPKIQKVQKTLKPEMNDLVEKAKKLYQDKLDYFVSLSHKPPAVIVAAPGRVNLIGEHTDYTEGFVLPLATEFCTVAYGTGYLKQGTGSAMSAIRMRMVSDNSPEGLVEERRLVGPHHKAPGEDEPRSWADYIIGTMVQYIGDLPPEGCTMDIAVAFASNVPMGAGLSSSASLLVSAATFFEYFLKDMAFSSADKDTPKVATRALRCQTAENEWAHSPCGIMDQMASSACKKNNAMLLDCRSLEVTHVPFKKDKDNHPVILITDSKVEHEIADSEYGLRRAQCNDALEAMQQVPLYHVAALRDATLQDVKDTYEKGKMDETLFKRAKHVVNENQRTKECKTALKLGMWDRVGELMNGSHTSLRDDYEVSCEEIDFLVDIAQKHAGVYGSRITGGGFGGCSVTLVKQDQVEALKEALKSSYKEKYGKDCDCFVTTPGEGARVLAIDMDCKPVSPFYK